MSKLKIFIPCDEANHTCDKSQYKEASILEKIKLNIHLIYCRACREYTKNNKKLTKKIKDSKVACIDVDTKNKIKKTIETALDSNSI